MEPSAVEYISEKALEFKLGARGLRSLCEAILNDAMFDLPLVVGKGDKKTLVIDRDYAEDKLDRSRMARLKAA